MTSHTVQNNQNTLYTNAFIINIENILIIKQINKPEYFHQYFNEVNTRNKLQNLTSISYDTTYDKTLNYHRINKTSG
jgi:hypothetical protein